MDSRDPVVVFFEKSVIQSITLLRKWDFMCRDSGADLGPMWIVLNAQRRVFHFTNTSPIVTNIYSYDGYSSLFDLGWQELH